LEFFMPDQPSPEVELLRAAYATFNARDFDSAFATIAPEVAWPRALKRGVVRGHHDVRAYWTEQWSEIDPPVEPVSFHPEERQQGVPPVRRRHVRGDRPSLDEVRKLTGNARMKLVNPAMLGVVFTTLDKDRDGFLTLPPAIPIPKSELSVRL
jgi:hypothetical protein